MQNQPIEILTNKLLTLAEVINLVGISRAQIYILIGSGQFPATVHLPNGNGKRLRKAFWRLSDINTWINNLKPAEAEKKVI